MNWKLFVPIAAAVALIAAGSVAWAYWPEAPDEAAIPAVVFATAPELASLKAELDETHELVASLALRLAAVEARTVSASKGKDKSRPSRR